MGEPCKMSRLNANNQSEFTVIPSHKCFKYTPKNVNTKNEGKGTGTIRTTHTTSSEINKESETIRTSRPPISTKSLIPYGPVRPPISTKNLIPYGTVRPPIPVEITRSYQSAYTIERPTVRRIGTNHFHSSVKHYKKYKRSVDHNVILEVPVTHSKSSSRSSVRLPKTVDPKFNGYPICLCYADVKYSKRIRTILIPVIVIVIIVIVVFGIIIITVVVEVVTIVLKFSFAY